MSLKQTIYFMALVGGLSGLVCWSIVVWVTWMPDLITAAVLGMLIGGFTVFFADRWSGSQVVARWVLSGVVIGLAAGCLSGVFQIWASESLRDQKVLAVVASWMVTGTLIGFGTGLRWASVNKLRVLHALGGGMFGGILGGFVFASWTFVPDSFTQSSAWLADLLRALALMVTGIGITCGVTLAPVLLRDGVLRFVSSGDGRAQNKFGRTQKEWELHDGDSYVAGSHAGNGSLSMYGPLVQIVIPDEMVAERHAVIAGRKGQFIIEPHPENRGPQGLPSYPLQLRGQDIILPQVMRNGDSVLMGQTLLRFEMRKRRSS